MTQKSHISMEQHVCPVCCARHDTGNVLLNRRMRQSMDPHTVTGTSLCPEHQQKYDEGYIALVECDPAESTIKNNHIKPGEESRTGRYALLRRSVWPDIFNIPAPEDLSLVFIEPQAFEALAKMTGETPA